MALALEANKPTQQASSRPPGGSLRILAIKASLPESLRTGSNVTAYHTLLHLSRRHRVLMCCWEGKTEAAASLPFEACIRPLERGPTPGAESDRLLEHYGFSNAGGPWLRELINQWRPDVVLGFDYHTLPALAANPHCPRVACLVDNRLLEALVRLRRRGFRNWQSLKQVAWSAWLHWRYAEAADAFVFVTRREAAGFRLFTRRPCFVVPNGVDTEYFRPNGCAGPRRHVVFVGSLNYEPNVTAVCWLAENVWPRVRAVCPDARLRLVGKRPVPEILRLDGRDGIEVAADVPDIRPYLAQAAVAVAPMLTGGGIKNKILEAWASGLPVAATRHALHGLAAQPGRNILVADRPNEFTQHVIRCLQNPALRAQLGQNARQTAVRYHSWDLAARRLGHCLAYVAARKGNGQRV